jgi:integral membrane sensor domain MASE1
VLAVIGRPGLAAIALIFSTVCAAGCSWLQVARIKPTPRRDVIKRGGSGGSFFRTIVGVLIMLLGAAGLGCAASGYWVVATALLGGLTLAVIGCFTLVTMEDISSGDFATASVTTGGSM